MTEFNAESNDLDVRTSALRLCLGLSAVFLVVAGIAQESPVVRKQIEVTVQGSFQWGSVGGFMQIPQGGQPGSSSFQRPSLEELNIRDAVFYDAGAQLRWGHACFYGGAQFIDLEGSGTFDQPLTSHGTTFAAGESFHTDNTLNNYHAGIGWNFDWRQARLELTPKIDFAVLDFSYHLSSSSASASRSFSKGCVRLGLQGVYHLGSVVSLKLNGVASLPLSNTPQIAEVSGIVSFNLTPRSRVIRPAIFAGVGAEWIDYEDNQALPNHVKVNLGPFVTAGLAFSF